MGAKDERKYENLHKLIELLLGRPQGVTKAEIARKLGVHRSTAAEYLDSLEGLNAPVYEVSPGRYTIDRDHFEVDISVDMHEALALHLASRLLATRTDKHNPHAASALRKLGRALEKLAPLISDHMKRSADVLDGEDRRRDPIFMQVLETLTRAWSRRCKVRLTHEMEDGSIHQYTFSPYFIEPYAVGRTMHVIGHREPPGKIRTFKVERIRTIDLLDNSPYEIPDSFDPREQLKDAWGIWFSEHPPEPVKLHFSRQVAKRVSETVWHHAQEIAENPDGSIIWTAQVAEPREMLPWIKGWGADCEILEPEGLRQELKRETRRMSRLYKLESTEGVPNYFHLWAKTDKEYGSNRLHPLVYHLLDVGECTLALWNNSLSEQTKQVFACLLGLDIETSGRQLAFWASLHDLGKAAPGFQRKYFDCISLLEQRGFVFPKDISLRPAPHGILSTWALKELLLRETGMTPRDARMIAFALGGHHGAWPTNDRLQTPALQKSDQGDGLWDTVRKELLLALKEVYQPAEKINLPKNQDDLNAFLTLFSGLVSLADWIGSMVDNFPFMEEYLSAGKYASEYARIQAKDALERLGWLGWQADGNESTFDAMFPEIPSPNEIQQRTFEIAGCELPALVILEAPTGIGKTEAALYLADSWLQRQKGKGIYIAMPTQSTSNQMFERVVKFLEGRYPAQTINAHLVHGAALLKDDEETPQPQGIAEDDGSAEGGVKAETWFLPRKRTLLAPFGVGTVDQALMSVLQTNHFFVRMFGLGQKVVIFDEVHAYDTYMSTLFQRLLRWLRSIGTSVILLSATLPDQTRKELVGAWLGDEEITLLPAEYPRLTVASTGRLEIIELPRPESRSLQLDWAVSAPDQIAGHLAEKLKDGGCVAVICNRVKRAQEVYEAVKARGIVDAENLIIFHARFPFQWRKDIEERVLGLFSKKGKRPQKAIVVATQVIEQSLDLDFDYMVTDLAPVDLLLQRAGRLHRHNQNDSNRPANLKEPVLAIALPAEKNGLPDFGSDTHIYDKATLLRTWHVIHYLDRLVLPEQTCGLIETVYGKMADETQFDPIFQQALCEADEKARLGKDKEVAQAKQRMVALPGYEDFITDRNDGLEEDDPMVNDAFRALTRLAEPSVSLICLHETTQGIALEPDYTGAPIDTDKRPNLKQARQLLKRAVNVQRRDVVDYFVKNIKSSAEWKRSAAVRYHYPVVFKAGEWSREDASFTLKLDKETGLEVLSKEAK